MWLWYLELYVVLLLAFLLGAGLGAVAVRLLVRRTHGFSLGLSDPEASHDSADSTPAGVGTSA